MNSLIYILEDDVEVANVIARALLQDGHSVEKYANRKDFLAQLKRQKPDLCLVDLSLPDGNGLSLIADQLRSLSIPSIVVSGKSNLTDRIVGLEIGADDYIVKPFEPRELSARVRAVLRRANTEVTPDNINKQEVAVFAGWEVNFLNCTLISPAQVKNELSASETRLLRAFVESSGRVLSRSQLMDHLRNDDLEPFDRSVDARVSRLRKKLNDDPKSPLLIRTVYGAGYVFSAKVEWR